MGHLDFTINVPTLIAILAIAGKLFRWVNKMTYKLETMWIQFLIDHPEYERREGLRQER